MSTIFTGSPAGPMGAAKTSHEMRMVRSGKEGSMSCLQLLKTFTNHPQQQAGRYDRRHGPSLRPPHRPPPQPCQAQAMSHHASSSTRLAPGCADPLPDPWPEEKEGLGSPSVVGAMLGQAPACSIMPLFFPACMRKSTHRIQDGLGQLRGVPPQALQHLPIVGLRGGGQGAADVPMLMFPHACIDAGPEGTILPLLPCLQAAWKLQEKLNPVPRASGAVAALLLHLDRKAGSSSLVSPF